MTHVQIQQGDTPETLKVLIDGVDISKHIYCEGFGLMRVGPVGDPAGQAWGVRMIVAADALDVDLPDAVIEATKSGDQIVRERQDCPACKAERKVRA